MLLRLKIELSYKPTTMRTFLIIFLVLSSITLHAQSISAEILVNNEEKVKSLSRSKLNVITVKGNGCDQFEISTICASSKKIKAGYEVKPSSSCSEVIISVMAIKDGNRMMLLNQRFEVVD